MQLILNMIEKVLQLTIFKLFTKNQNFSFNFINEKYFLNYKLLIATDDS